MSVKRMGRAELNLDEEFWHVKGAKGKYLINRRLVDSRRELKTIKSKYAKDLQKDTPSRRKTQRRERYDIAREGYKRDFREALVAIYEEIRQDSFTRPVLLHLANEFTARAVWRYCLYRGMIYQFDRPEYSDEEMTAQIDKLEG